MSELLPLGDEDGANYSKIIAYSAIGMLGLIVAAAGVTRHFRQPTDEILPLIDPVVSPPEES